jgi:hypothetical protein
MLRGVKKLTWITVLMIASGILLVSRCVDGPSGKKADEAEIAALPAGFAGSATCGSCHQDIFEKHLNTAHFKTTRPTEEKYLMGSFHHDSNRFHFNRSVYVAMEKRDSGWYQVEYFRDEEKKARRMDIIVGSGAMGQSFLNWRSNGLFQLPITYFSAARAWSNSPGFPDRVVFNRTITSRCMECHATYAEVISPEGKEPESFRRNNIIYGVDCEKCHGPAAQHVQFHTSHPQDSVGRFIVNPSGLSRQQNLDLCALCHGGRLQKTKPSFSFQAGNHLSDHFVVDTTPPDPNRIDVHGNQYGLLRASKCFRMSPTLTCNSCHNTHENERGKTALFSARCMTCHQPSQPHFCPMEKTIGKTIRQNCVDCHMPVKPSRAIAVFLAGAEAPLAAQIRSHFVSIYPEETKKILAALQAKK